MLSSTSLFLAVLAGTATAAPWQGGSYSWASGWSSSSSSASQSSSALSASYSASSSLSSTFFSTPSGTGSHPSYPSGTESHPSYPSGTGSHPSYPGTGSYPSHTSHSLPSPPLHTAPSVNSGNLNSTTLASSSIQYSSYAPSGTTETITKLYPTTVTKTITRFVPCSTPVSSSGTTIYYSTWLTQTTEYSTYVATSTDLYTVYPTPAAEISKFIGVSYPTNSDMWNGNAATTTIYGQAEGTCAPEKTVVVTYTVTEHEGSSGYATGVLEGYETETVVATLKNGQETTITITNWVTETSKASIPYISASSSSSPNAPSGTGSPSGGKSALLPKGTGYNWPKPSGWAKQTGGTW